MHLNRWVNNTASRKFLDTDNQSVGVQTREEWTGTGVVRTSCSHKRRPWEKYRFSKEKKGIVFSLGVLHSVREMQKALLLQKEFRMKGKNFKFNKYNFYCLKTTSCFPWVLNTIYFFMQPIFAGDLRHAWQSVVKQSTIYIYLTESDCKNPARLLWLCLSSGSEPKAQRDEMMARILPN